MFSFYELKRLFFPKVKVEIIELMFFKKLSFDCYAINLNFHFTVISSKNSGMNLIKGYVLSKKLVMRIRNILSEKVISTLDVNSFSLFQNICSS